MIETSRSATRAGSERATPLERIVHPFQVFAKKKLAGAICLLAATLIALVWANSPWAPHYDALLDTRIVIGIGAFQLSKPLLLWVNDGLMGIFFFVVGLEIKRELLVGEISSVRKALLEPLRVLQRLVQLSPAPEASAPSCS